jgi:hypothetical protein
MVGKILGNQPRSDPGSQQEPHRSFPSQETKKPDVVHAAEEPVTGAHVQQGPNSAAVNQVDIGKPNQEWDETQDRVCGEWA